MKNKFSLIQRQYKYEREENVFLIEMSLDDYDDVYDEWDPAPFKKRFIEESFDEFIVSSAEDIPLKYKLNIVLYLPEIKKDTNKEIAVESAYKNYYGYVIEKIKKSRIKLRKKNLSYFLLSLLFLSCGYFFQLGIENIFSNVFQEGITIGGWVFLWEFFTNIFIKRREINAEYQSYIRIYHSEIRFMYI
jgi:hypothetical protein